MAAINQVLAAMGAKSFTITLHNDSPYAGYLVIITPGRDGVLRYTMLETSDDPGSSYAPFSADWMESAGRTSTIGDEYEQQFTLDYGTVYIPAGSGTWDAISGSWDAQWRPANGEASVTLKIRKAGTTTVLATATYTFTP